MAQIAPFNLIIPKKNRVGILISIPHLGTEIPEEYRSKYKEILIEKPQDTDWFVDQLYPFAEDLGITIIMAKYSRYLIDLNRSPDNKPLYDDGRTETGLVPTKDFSGRSLYKSEFEPNSEDINSRKTQYYQPYHAMVAQYLKEFQENFGNALLFEAHSIRREVPLLHPHPFPDLIIGDQNGTTCAPSISKLFLDKLSEGPYSVSHNSPFKGGYLTRKWGQKEKNIHSIQLEISQDVYMDEKQFVFEPNKARSLIETLEGAFRELPNTMETL